MLSVGKILHTHTIKISKVFKNKLILSTKLNVLIFLNQFQQRKYLNIQLLENYGPLKC